MDRVRNLVHASYAHKLGYIGSGVTVAVMDTGIVAHPDFDHRIQLFRDYTSGKQKMYDDNGHGTHVAGIIGGSGFASHGKYMGIAPGCNLAIIKVLDKSGNGSTNQVIQALKWLINNKDKYNIRILNVSVGMLTSAKQEERRRLIEAVEDVWNHNIVVVAAAGNNGPKEGSITIPGMCKSIITVGSCDDDIKHKPPGLIRGYSGRGPTEGCVIKPEITAPGTAIMSCTPQNMSYEIKSGTSMATPVVSGVIALMLDKYPSLTPAQVKIRMYETAVDIGKEKNVQGWGMIDVARLI